MFLGHQGHKKLSHRILLAMDTTQRRANVRVYVSKSLQQSHNPRGALIMVAGAGGGIFHNSNLIKKHSFMFFRLYRSCCKLIYCVP